MPSLLKISAIAIMLLQSLALASALPVTANNQVHMLTTPEDIAAPEQVLTPELHAKLSEGSAESTHDFLKSLNCRCGDEFISEFPSFYFGKECEEKGAQCCEKLRRKIEAVFDVAHGVLELLKF